MRTHFLYVLIGLFFICTSHQMFAQAKKPTERGYIQPQTSTQQNNNKTTNAVNYATKAEKYAADGLTVAGSKDKTKSAVKKNASNVTPPYNNTVPTQNASASNVERCGTDAHIANRTQSIQERQIIKELREIAADKIANFIPCDGSNSIVIPVAVHYGPNFDCSNTQCLIDAAVNSIEKLNDDFAALNADIAYYNSLNAACPAGYPLDVVSDGTCMQFCLATQNHPAAENIADGQPAITIGQYTWSGGPDAPNWSGYANLFIEANTGGLGIAAAPGLANGDGVQMDASTWGGAGLAPCSSGASLNTNTTYDLGRTLTHELGHYFDLFHTFQGGCADGDTGTFSGQVNVINDTPATATPFFGCPTVTSCADAPASGCASQYAQITNYMDYTDDACMVMFTQDQAAVMNGWANSLSFVSDATVCAPPMSLTSLAACSLQAAFDPSDGTDILVCTDDGTTIQFEDLSTNGPVTWDWTFTVTGGDIVLSAANSTMQNPAPMVTAGTTGTLQVDLIVTDVNGVVETATQSYTVTLVSGDDCPNECDYTLELTDTFGDGWNGATLDILAGGAPIAGSPYGTTFTAGTSEINTITLTDGQTISFNQTNGGFPGEEGFILTDPFGNVIFDSSAGGVGAGEVFSFAAYCSAPTCDDGIQNGEEGGVDCGGASPCPDCCSNGIQDDGETGVDCGGANCAPCPACPDGFAEIINETFDSCMMPSGWAVTATDGGTADITFTGGPNDVPGGLTPSPDFTGCIATIDDDANDAIGIGCVITPVIDLSAYLNTSLTFDWQNNDFAGSGDFTVEVYDGTMWVQVFIEEEDNFGTNQTVSLDPYINPNFQIRFCYNDEGGFAWGAGFDNVSVCGEFNNECPTQITTNDVSGDYCNGADAIVTANFNPNATYTWSSDNPNVVIVDAAAGSTSVEFAAPTQCMVETANISLLVVCDIDGVELFNGVVSTVNVYPAAPATPADLEALLVIGEPGCDEPVTVVAGCETFVVLTPDAANPTFPVNSGEAGTATYTATYTSTPDCCPDVSGATTDLVIDGSFEAGPGGGAWVEASTNFGSPICDLGACGTGTGTGPSDGGFWAWFGGIGASEVGSVCQSITVPAGLASLTLSFDLETIICDNPSDFMEVTIDGTQVFFVDGSAASCGVLGYTTQTIDLLAAGIAEGATYTLCFESEIFALNGAGSNFFVDNIQLLAEQPPMEDPCMITVTGDYDCGGCSVTPATISTTSNTDICTGDGAPDLIDVTVDDAGIGNAAWVITDANGIVLALPTAPPFDLEGAGAGTCLIWLANIDDPNFAIAPGDDAAAVIAAFCAELSNPITVTRADDCAPMLAITDPCNCDNGLDLDNNGSNDILVETITIMPGAAPYTITDYSGGLVDMAGNALDQAALQALLDVATPDADGNVSISVYIPADGATVFSITVADGNGATASFTKPSPCTSCAPLEDVPTVGEWGLIILGLMMSIVAIVGIRERRKVYA